MSRTKKKSWHLHNSDGWHGIKQALRDRLRPKIIYRDALRRNKRNRGHNQQEWTIIRALFSRGFTLEYIYKNLVEKNRCSSREATLLIGGFGSHKSYHPGAPLEVQIDGMVCIRDNRIVPLATPELEPYFLINIDLPIYNTSSIDTNYKYYSYNNWESGQVVYIDGKIYKFSQKHSATIGCSEDELKKAELEIWPNENVTSMIGEVVDLHVENGMEKCSFKIHGWKNLRYSIEIK